MAKILTGEVVSTKMQDTVVVQVQRSYRHPLYQKTIKRHKKYKVDTNGMTIGMGNVVKIQETRPLSRDKHFKVVEIIQSS